MSGLLPILYNSFKLPYHRDGRIPAYTSAAKRIDGNTDSNNDGEVNQADKNGFIEPAELYEVVFNNRGKYNFIIEQLYQAGLEDPFEITLAIETHVKNIFDRYQPNNDLEKAFFLFLSIIPPEKSIKFGELVFNGLTAAEGGLEINYDDVDEFVKRNISGDLLPKELMMKDSGRRIALCTEFSHLLVTFLRAAGIQAHAKHIPYHSYTIAILDGQKYRLDATGMVFKETKIISDSDRKGIAVHYNNEGDTFLKQTRRVAASNSFNLALEFDPNNSLTWFNKGVLRFIQEEYEAAISCFDKALELNPKHRKAKYYKKLTEHLL